METASFDFRCNFIDSASTNFLVGVTQGETDFRDFFLEGVQCRSFRCKSQTWNHSLIIDCVTHAYGHGLGQHDHSSRQKISLLARKAMSFQLQRTYLAISEVRPVLSAVMTNISRLQLRQVILLQEARRVWVSEVREIGDEELAFAYQLVPVLALPCRRRVGRICRRRAQYAKDNTSPKSLKVSSLAHAFPKPF